MKMLPIQLETERLTAQYRHRRRVENVQLPDEVIVVEDVVVVKTRYDELVDSMRGPSIAVVGPAVEAARERLGHRDVTRVSQTVCRVVPDSRVETQSPLDVAAFQSFVQ